ncbi:MAG TPA: hypothetical protein VF796_11255, partial [Humisphaera sp.]
SVAQLQLAGPAGGIEGLAGTPGLDMGKDELLDAQVAIAARFSTAAQEVLRAPNAERDPAAWRLACTFLEAAQRLDTQEPRYPRLRALSLFDLGDADQAAPALAAYLSLVPDDDFARLRLAEHYASRMQTTDERLKYYRHLMDTPTIRPEVKSRVATWAAGLLLERSQSDAAAMVATAIGLDPLNVYAQRMHWALVARDGTPEQRLRSQLAQLRCDPSQIQVLTAVGRELAAAGLVRDGAKWYGWGLAVALRTETPVDPSFLVEYASLLFLDGQPQAADEVLGRMLAMNQTVVPAWFLQMIVRRGGAGGAGNVAFEEVTQRAREQLAARASTLSRLIKEEADAAAAAGPVTTAPASRPASRPTSRPDGSLAPIDLRSGLAGGAAGGPLAPGDTAGPGADALAETIRLLKQPGASEYYLQEFTEAIGDLAWCEVYFARNETAAVTWIDALAKLLGDAHPAVSRDRGFLQILRRDDAGAMKTLWPLRKADPAAAMGVADLLSRGSWNGPAAPAAGTSRPATAPARSPDTDPDVLVQRLLDEHPTGLTGALVAGHFRDRKLFARPAAVAAQLSTILAREFPLELLDVVARPELFYAPSGRPAKDRTRVGDPVMARVSLTNRSDFDLPIGPDGIIKPDLWFDTRVVLGVERPFPMSGSDRLAGPLVLKARSEMSQVVRVDTGAVADALRERPSASVDIYATVMTNPLVTKDYKVIAGPGGVRREFPGRLIRVGAPVGQDLQRKRLYDAVAGGLPNEKLWALDVLAAQVEQTRGPDIDKVQVPFGREFLEQISRARGDRVPQVAGWATLLDLRLADPNDPKGAEARLRAAEALARSPAWENRLLSVWAGRALPVADRKRVVSIIAADAHPLVRQAAAYELDLVARAPAAGPTTAPGARPVVGNSPLTPPSPTRDGPTTLPVLR